LLMENFARPILQPWDVETVAGWDPINSLFTIPYKHNHYRPDYKRCSLSALHRNFLDHEYSIQGECIQHLDTRPVVDKGLTHMTLKSRRISKGERLWHIRWTKTAWAASWNEGRCVGGSIRKLTS